MADLLVGVAGDVQSECLSDARPQVTDRLQGVEDFTAAGPGIHYPELVAGLSLKLAPFQTDSLPDGRCAEPGEDLRTPLGLMPHELQPSERAGVLDVGPRGSNRCRHASNQPL